MAIVELDDDTFESRISEGLVLVDFWAEWCVSCKGLALAMNQLSAEMRGVRFCTVNADENPGTTISQSVSSVPTLALYRNGELVDRVTGAIPKERIRKVIEAHL